MNKMNKIFGAVAIIGLFLLCSMSTGLAAQGQQQQQQIPGVQQGQAPGYQAPPNDIINWNGVGALPSYDCDGQDGGLVFGNTYPLPSQWAPSFPSYYSLNFNPAGIIFNNPQYVTYFIAIKRTDDGGILGKHQQFKAVIANIGKADNPFTSFTSRIWVIHILPYMYEVEKQGIAVRGVGVRVITSPKITSGLLGSTVLVNPDYNNVPAQQYPNLFRVRRFVSNYIDPMSSLLYDLLIDSN